MPQPGDLKVSPDNSVLLFNGKDWEVLCPVEDPLAKDFDLTIQISDEVFVTCTPQDAIRIITRIHNPTATRDSNLELVETIKSIVTKWVGSGIAKPGVLICKDLADTVEEYLVLDSREVYIQILEGSPYINFDALVPTLLSTKVSLNRACYKSITLREESCANTVN
jgi:hypothetical protein